MELLSPLINVRSFVRSFVRSPQHVCVTTNDSAVTTIAERVDASLYSAA